MQDQASHNGEQLDTSTAQMQEVVEVSDGDEDLSYWQRVAGTGVDDGAVYLERPDNVQK